MKFNEMKNYQNTFTLFVLLLICSNLYAQETVTVDVQMPCGVAGTPACFVQMDSSGIPSAELNISDPVINPDFSIINILTPAFEFTFPFQKTSCNVQSVTQTILNRPSPLNIDYCKFANIVNDVCSIMAYFITAGYLINLVFKSRS